MLLFFFTEMANRVKAGETPPFRPKVSSESCSPELFEIMINCWDETPEIRPSFDAIDNTLKKQLK